MATKTTETAVVASTTGINEHNLNLKRERLERERKRDTTGFNEQAMKEHKAHIMRLEEEIENDARVLKQAAGGKK